MAFVVGVAVFLLFEVLDVLLCLDPAANMWRLRFLLVGPVLLLLLAVSFSPLGERNLSELILVSIRAVSVGVASTVPRSEDAPEALVAAADRALYAAKEPGGNRVVMA